MKNYDLETLKRLQSAELHILKDFDRVCGIHDIKYFLDWGSLIGAVRHKGFIPWDDDLDVSMTRIEYQKFINVMSEEMGDNYILATPVSYEGYCSVVTKLMRKHTKFVPEFSNEMKCELGIHIDIFVWDNLCDLRLGAWIQIIAVRLLAQLIFLCGSSNPIIVYKGIIGKSMKAICRLIHNVLNFIPNIEKKLYKCFEKVSKMYNYKNTENIVTFQTPGILKYVCKRENLEPYKKIGFEGIKVSVANNYKEHLSQAYGDYMKLPPENERMNHCAEIIDFGDVY